MQDFAHALVVLLSRVERLSGEAVTNKGILLQEQFVENWKDLTLRRDIKRWAGDHPTATFQDVRLEVHRYMEEDPVHRRSAATRAVAVEEDEMLCGKLQAKPRTRKYLQTLFLGRRCWPGRCKSNRRC